MIINSKDNHKLIEALNQGGVAVIKTDTLYGLVARAAKQAAVQQVYDLKRRNPAKSLIVLIADTSQLYDQPENDLDQFWPGPNSLILPSPSAPDWLKNQDGTVAYRLPVDEELRRLIRRTGPLVAPSANLEGQLPAQNVETAFNYFGDSVQCYVDEGEVPIDQPPSKLWRWANDQWKRLR